MISQRSENSVILLATKSQAGTCGRPPRPRRTCATVPTGTQEAWNQVKRSLLFGPGGRHADFMGVCVSWDQRPTVVFGGSPRSFTALLLCLCRLDKGLRTNQNIPASSPLCPHRRNVGKRAFGAWLSP